MRFEKEVKKILLDMEMTIDELAVELDMSSSAVRQRLKREGVSLDWCKKVLETLGKELKIYDATKNK